MTPERAFSLLNLFALAGWVVLAAGVVARRPLLYDRVAGRGFPFVLGLAYAGLIAFAWGSSEGGFSTLGGVRSLFQSDWLLLAGWVHYLAFDLFVGAWIARRTIETGLNRAALIPVLPLTFLFGPVGFVAFGIVRALAPSPAALPRRQSEAFTREI
jgi:hypothetical protein